MSLSYVDSQPNTPVALRQVYSRLTQRFYREMLPKALASRSILPSRLHCGEKSLLLVKLAPLGISIRAPTRSVPDGLLFPYRIGEELPTKRPLCETWAGMLTP